MGGYLINFSIYTMAMIGIIFFALFVYKSVQGKSFSKKSQFLSVLDTLSLSPRKSLYVIKAGDEKFLVAADLDRTALIAKLGQPENNDDRPLKVIRQDKSDELSSFDGIESLDEFADVLNFHKNKKSKGPVMRELAKKLSVM